MKRLLLVAMLFGGSMLQADCCFNDCVSTSTTCVSACSSDCDNDCDVYARSIFVPRQLAYNPILENALELNARVHEDWKYLFSVKPLYQQSVGDKFDRYFNINHKECLAVREDGSGDIDSLWFEVISTYSTFYSSTLSFEPKIQKYGAGLYGAFQLPKKFQIIVNTAVVGVRTDMNICETQSEFLGTVTGFETMRASFASSQRCYGKITCDSHTKVGLDDIQVKLLRNVYESDKATGSLYALLGIPTHSGSKVEYLFEPLVGSKHAQVGFGGYLNYDAYEYDSGMLTILAEAKYRYAFGAHERRSFDLKRNGQWSRYLLFVTEETRNKTFFAINDLSLKAKVTPASSLDMYLALHGNVDQFHFELGYDFWYRSAERIDLDCFPYTTAGVADLVGIAKLSPKSADFATMAQAVQPGINQMPSNSAFVPLTIQDINACSGAAPLSFSNSVYASAAYAFDYSRYDMRLGLNVAYERGHGVNVPDNVMAWIDFGINF